MFRFHPKTKKEKSRDREVEEIRGRDELGLGRLVSQTQSQGRGDREAQR